MRHDKIRDVEASILRDVCKDVKIEPELLPVGDIPVGSSTTAERARLDLSAVGVFSQMERTFGDVRVTHLNSPTYAGMSIGKVYATQEKEKKQKYNERIMQVEKATFTPLVFSTSGGMGPECTKFHKKVAELVSNKTKEDYSKVMNHIRTRLRFTLLKSVLIGIRGERGKSRKSIVNITEISFNTVPEMQTFEV